MNLISFTCLAAIFLFFYSCGLQNNLSAISKNDEALAEYNAGNYEKSIDLFKEALQRPGTGIAVKANIYRNLAHAFYEIGESDSSLFYSEFAANCYTKDSYDYLVNIADVQLMRDSAEAALSSLLKAYKKSPDEIAVNNSLGLIYLGDYGEQFTDPAKALAFNKQAFLVNQDRITEDVLARNYYELGDYPNAALHYGKLRKEYPDMLVYNLNLGMSKYQLGLTYEAENLFSELLAADSSYIFLIEAFKEELP